MTLTLNLQHHVTTQANPTKRTMDIAVMFGLSLDGTTDHTIIPPIQLTLNPGTIVFVTGVSGGGKSTLLRLISQAIASPQSTPTEQSPALIRTDQLPDLPDKALVDVLAQTQASPTGQAQAADLNQVCRWLSMAGLSDAAVMLRKPKQLSEGQRHRLQLAQAMSMAQQSSKPWSVLLIDEFCSTLDRITATALARSIRRWVSQSNVCLVAATTHDDLLEPLGPDVLVEVAPGGQCHIHNRPK